MSDQNGEYKPPFTLNARVVNLISEISALAERISITEDVSGRLRLRRKNRIKTIQSSLAIEANTLSLEQVTTVLDGKKVLAPPNEIREVVNAGSAYELMPSLNPYAIDDLLKAHGAMMEGLKIDAGHFRAGQVGVMAGDAVIHMAPPASFVWAHMTNLLAWVKATDYHPLISSSLFHYEFEYIHPFSDGNGRMGRYWQSLLLSKWKDLFAWLPVETVIKDRQKEYYQALAESTQKNEGGIFVEFMLSAILATLTKHHQSDQVSDQVGDQVKELLFALGSETLSASVLMERIGVSHRTNFRKNYLGPALAQNLIERTIPDKPNSSNQKYRKKPGAQLHQT
ncbi:MAG: Fic family protein [Clostridia bacterium]|nr:Fic family protein [Clostridia bacterium]